MIQNSEFCENYSPLFKIIHWCPYLRVLDGGLVLRGLRLAVLDGRRDGALHLRDVHGVLLDVRIQRRDLRGQGVDAGLELLLLRRLLVDRLVGRGQLLVAPAGSVLYADNGQTLQGPNLYRFFRKFKTNLRRSQPKTGTLFPPNIVYDSI